jgi:hypothetical protein
MLFVIALQLADLATTWFVLAHGGAELNGAVAALMARFGVLPGLALVKAFACGCLYLSSRIRPRALRKAQVFYSLIVLWNLGQIWSMVG